MDSLDGVEWTVSNREYQRVSKSIHWSPAHLQQIYQLNLLAGPLRQLVPAKLDLILIKLEIKLPIIKAFSACYRPLDRPLDHPSWMASSAPSTVSSAVSSAASPTASKLLESKPLLLPTGNETLNCSNVDGPLGNGEQHQTNLV